MRMYRPLKNDDEDGDKADEDRFRMDAAALLEHEGGMMGWVVGCFVHYRR